MRLSLWVLIFHRVEFSHVILLLSKYFSRAVSENTLSLKDICWLLFTLNDINLTTLQIYNHYNTIDLGVVRLAAYSIFRNFLYF